MNGTEDAVASVPVWYHTMELAPGVVTPGWFDLRPIVDHLPWPGVAGKRCLDVGTYDGFLAFELERRGASEVVAIDIDDHDRWDWPPDVRATGPGSVWLLPPERARIGGNPRRTAETLIMPDETPAERRNERPDTGPAGEPLRELTLGRSRPSPDPPKARDLPHTKRQSRVAADPMRRARQCKGSPYRQ